MYEKIDKYIYKIGENKYRIKIQKKDSKSQEEINFSKNYECSVEEVKIIRDKILEEYENKIQRFLNDNKQSNKQKIKYIEKYIYQLNKNKYRIQIKKGTKGELGYCNICNTIEGTLSDARKLRNKILAELILNKRTSFDKGNITFENFVKIFLDNQLPNYSPTTIGGVINKVNYYLLPELGKYKLNKIDVLLLQKYINSLSKKKNHQNKDKYISTTTANGVYRLLRNILNRAVDWEYIEKNPLLKIKAPVIQKAEKNTISIDEMNEFIEHLNKEPISFKCMIFIIITTGARRGEMLGIHCDEIDLKNNIINIKHNVVRDTQKHKIVEKNPKTKESIREIPFPEITKKVLLEYLNYRKEQIEFIKKLNPKYNEIENLFFNENGNLVNPDYPTVKWKKFLERNKLKKVTIHELRHSYCTMQVNDNKELGIKDVSTLMGHSQLSTTFHYSHHNRDKNKQVLSIFDEIDNGKKFELMTALSICKKRQFTSKSKIEELVNYLVEDDTLPFSTKLDVCSEIIKEDYPSVNDIDINNIKQEEIFDWIENMEDKKSKYIYIRKRKEQTLEKTINI